MILLKAPLFRSFPHYILCLEHSQLCNEAGKLPHEVNTVTLTVLGLCAITVVEPVNDIHSHEGPSAAGWVAGHFARFLGTQTPRILSGKAVLLEWRGKCVPNFHRHVQLDK